MIVVVSPEPVSPAWRALRMEGLTANGYVVSGPNDYGEIFTELWNEGVPFVLIEWDIVPWPGAVTHLLRCPEPRCTYRYPMNQGRLQLGFGIGKYEPVDPAPEHWATTRWDALDGQVVPVLNERLGPPHVHEPAVAHARREVQ